MATVVSLGALVVVLVLVARPVRGVPDVAVAVPAAVLVVPTGADPWRAAAHEARALAPTLAFLVAIFVVAEAADGAGLFAAAGRAVRRLGTRSDRRLVLAVAAGAVAVTTVLSLDATVVLFTPVVVGVVRQRRATADACLLATAHLANAGSLLLPVSNLTNLLVVGATGLGFGGFALRMLLPAVVAGGVVTASCIRLVPAPVASGPPAAPAKRGEPLDVAERLDRMGRLAGAVLVALLVGFFVVSLFGVAPAWVAAAGAILLGAVVIRARRVTTARLLAATSPAFLAFVIALAVVVDAAQRHGLGRVVRRTVPGGTGLLALLGIAAVAAILAAATNNLPATLVLLKILPAGAVGPLLAVLVGVNVGPNLTYNGSLATLLWRRVVRAEGVEPSTSTYYRVALMGTPLAVAAATASLWLTLKVVG